VRVVFDTNVLVAAVAVDGLCRDLVRVRLRPHTIVTSEPLLTELQTTLRSKFKIAPEELPLWSILRERAEFAIPAPLGRRVCRDKDDDVVLATAVSGHAKIIVTGDKDLLVLKRFREIRILSPRQFLELLDRLP
jgi:uncharacterized protein